MTSPWPQRWPTHGQVNRGGAGWLDVNSSSRRRRVASGTARSVLLRGEKLVANQIVWVDIPVLDLDRAVRFYSAVLGAEVQKQEHPGRTVAVLPDADSGVSGCLFTKDDETPSDRGMLVYLNAQGRLDEAIAAVESSGGKVLKPKHQIGPYGVRAVVLDSEGNRVALHSM